MIYATADTDLCIPIDNLSTAHKHYDTYTNLCSAARSTLETIYNLPAVYDHQYEAICFGDMYQTSRRACRLLHRKGKRLCTAAGLSQSASPCSGTTDSEGTRLKACRLLTCGTHGNLSSNLTHLFRPYCNSWAAVQPYKTQETARHLIVRFFSPTNTKPCKTSLT
jgi:hypothetical protein